MAYVEHAMMKASLFFFVLFGFFLLTPAIQGRARYAKEVRNQKSKKETDASSDTENLRAFGLKNKCATDNRKIAYEY